MWMQIIADVTGRPVYTLADDVEASLGAAMLAAFGAGLIGADAVRQGWVTPLPRTTPQPAAHAAYNHFFQQYVELYPALKSTMHRLRQPPQGDIPTT
jgi:sugar (pentulose or hexulose) kinase